MKHNLDKLRTEYPKTCASCGGSLKGAPENDDEFLKMIKEHDERFPDSSIETAELVCGECYKEFIKWMNEQN